MLHDQKKLANNIPENTLTDVMHWSPNISYEIMRVKWSDVRRLSLSIEAIILSISLIMSYNEQIKYNAVKMIGNLCAKMIQNALKYDYAGTEKM